MPDNRQDSAGDGARSANDPGRAQPGAWAPPRPWQPPPWPPPGAWPQPGAWQPGAAGPWPAGQPFPNPWMGPGYRPVPYAAAQPYRPGPWPLGSVPWGYANPPAVPPVLEPPGSFHPPAHRPILSLKGRASPRLYGLGLGLGLPGITALIVYLAVASAGFKPSFGPVPRWLALEGVCVAAALGQIGWALAQARQRRADGWLDYSGPSPALMFGLLLAIVTAVEVPLKAGLDGLKIDVDSGLATLLLVTVYLSAYIGLVQLMAVRSGALTWRDIAHPGRLAPSSDDWSAGGPIPGWTRRAGETISSWRSRVAGGRLGDLLVPLAMTIPLIIVTNLLSAAMLLVLGLDASDVASFRTSGPVSNLDRLFVFVAVAILTPIGEETFFRGFATNAWGRSLSRGSTIIRGSLFFAFVHVLNTSTPDADLFWRVAILNFGARVPVAFALTWLYMRRRSILASGSLHACYNGLLVIIAFL
jgi:membrane protease YdiL (CAAX protease family)